MQPPSIYTIGHSTHPIDRFIRLLRENAIETLVDVRSVPFSRFNPQYRKRALESTLTEAGIGYVYLGESLGGRPGESRGFRPEDLIDYGWISEQAWYQQGLSELLDIAQGSTCAIMCSEENPAKCHRNLLVGQSLINGSLAQIAHIRGDGSVEPGESTPQQKHLF